jgi:hypothetical protein
VLGVGFDVLPDVRAWMAGGISFVAAVILAVVAFAESE